MCTNYTIPLVSTIYHTLTFKHFHVNWSGKKTKEQMKWLRATHYIKNDYVLFC